MNYSVYIMLDRDSDSVYVGGSSNVEARVNNHLSKAKDGALRKDRWLLEILRAGRRPVVTVVECGLSAKVAQKAEKRWITYLRQLGCEVLNETCGGEGYGFRKSKRNLLGFSFDRLVVIGEAPSDAGYRRRWLVRCSCGSVRIVVEYELLVKHTRSCGCLSSDVTAARNSTHGGTRDREYVIWSKMISRCENPKVPQHPRYGGRGITVCDRWRNSYPNFLSDVGRMPTPKHTLERKDNNKGYSPDNCCWATRREQANNRENTLFVEYAGEKISVADLARRAGMKYYTLRMRLRRGWPVEKAVIEKITGRRTEDTGIVEMLALHVCVSLPGHESFVRHLED